MKTYEKLDFWNKQTSLNPLQKIIYEKLRISKILSQSI